MEGWWGKEDTWGIVEGSVVGLGALGSREEQWAVVG